MKHGQEAGGADDGNAEGLSQIQQIMVVRGDRLHLGSQRSGERGIVPRILAAPFSQRQRLDPADLVQIPVEPRHRVVDRLPLPDDSHRRLACLLQGRHRTVDERLTTRHPEQAKPAFALPANPGHHHVGIKHGAHV